MLWISLEYIVSFKSKGWVVADSKTMRINQSENIKRQTERDESPLSIKSYAVLFRTNSPSIQTVLLNHPLGCKERAIDED